MKLRFLLAALLWSILPASLAAQQASSLAARSWQPERPWEVIDVAIALDTSGSMEKLIDSARLSLWEILDDLALLEPTPVLRVGLITYGTCNADSFAGWVRVETDLTQDLDLVSERLFAPTCDGGGEYVGRVLETALRDLSWTESRDALKLIFIAGNEPADQDPKVSFREMSERARDEGILVHAIFCGDQEHEAAGSWKELAELAQGRFAAFDQEAAPTAIATPFDGELAALGAALNETYLPLGEEGRRRFESLARQDARAAELGVSAAAGRAQVKASRLYAPGWDLIEALEPADAALGELAESELPDELRAMSPEERELHVEQMRLRREELQYQIAETARRRREHIDEKIEARGLDTSSTFAGILRRAIQESAEQKGFRSPPR